MLRNKGERGCWASTNLCWWGGGCTHDVRCPVAFVSWTLFLLFPFLVDPSSEEHTVCLELVVPSLRAARQRHSASLNWCSDLCHDSSHASVMSQEDSRSPISKNLTAAAGPTCCAYSGSLRRERGSSEPGKRDKWGVGVSHQKLQNSSFWASFPGGSCLAPSDFPKDL